MKRIVVYTSKTGFTKKYAEWIAEQNGIPTEDFYYFEGGYAPQKVGFMGRTMIKMIAGNIEKKEDKTQEDLHMLEMISGADHTKKDAIEVLL